MSDDCGDSDPLNYKITENMAFPAFYYVFCIKQVVCE